MNTSTAPARIIFTSTTESKVVQVMSDIWEEFNFFVTEELVDGNFVRKEVIVQQGMEKPVVNATEADKAKARAALRKQGEQAILSALAWVKVNDSGCFVEVVKGRKVPKGSKGLILKSGVNNFGKWFLIRFRDGSKNFVSADNCSVDFPLSQEDMESIALAGGKDSLDKAVEALSLSGLNKAADDARLTVTRVANGLREGRLQFV